MTRQQEALRIAGKFLRLQAVSDLCFVMLPMKYRMGKEEIEEVKAMGQRHARRGE